ncbi:MAG: tetratricopeptide repeat protein [Paludibacteraceae bacterium]|nr:tetratricopeptide repeat protein [Paludibacteraceae bacterium]
MKRKLIILIGLVLGVMNLNAKLTVEQQQRFDYYYYEAIRLFQAEDFGEAYQMFRFCYLLNPEDAMTNLYLGILYDGSRETERAVYFYRRANKLEKGNTYIKGNLLKADLMTGRLKEAMKLQKELDKINGYDVYSAMTRYRIHVMMKKYNAAANDIDHYLMYDPENLQFRYFQIQILETIKASTKRLGKAYEALLSLDPNNAIVLNNYAYMLSNRHGNLQLAEELSRKALQQDRNNATFLDTYAWILYLRGEKELAAFYIQKAIEQYNGSDVPPTLLKHYKTINHK